MDCIHGASSSQPFLFGFVCKFFDHPLGEMPKIILVVDVWEVLLHASDGNMAVCSNPVNHDPLFLQVLKAARKALFLAFDELTSETWTTLNATTSPESSSIKV